MTDLLFMCLGASDQTPRDTVLNYDADEPEPAELASAITHHAAAHLGIESDRVQTHFDDDSGYNVVRVDGGDTEGIDRFAFTVTRNPKIREKLEKPAVRISRPGARHYGSYGRLVAEDHGADTYVVELLHGVTEEYQRRDLADLRGRSHFEAEGGKWFGGDWFEGELVAPYEIGEYAWHRTGSDPIDFSLVQIYSRRCTDSGSFTRASIGWSLTVVHTRTGETVEVADGDLQKAPRDIQNLGICRPQAA